MVTLRLHSARLSARLSALHSTLPGALKRAVLVFLLTASAQSLAAAPSSFDWRLPTWVPRPVVPADNPMSEAKFQLGRHLFFDKRLSANGQLACAGCHHQAKGFTDGLAFSKGIHGDKGAKSAMALANVAYLPVLTWANPQIKSLELQALMPLFGESPVEMGMAGKEADLFRRLQSDTRYQRLFREAFPEEAAQDDARADNKAETRLFSLSTLTKALASFQRGLLSFNSPYDRYKYAGETQAISAAAKRGEALFFGERLECYHCHGGLNFTDNLRHERLPEGESGFHNTGLYNSDGKGAYLPAAPGISEFTGEASDNGKFRTPSLRNIAVTGPYMHDGSISRLEAVIKGHYARAGRSTKGSLKNPLRSELIEGFAISDAEVRDLVAFLRTLTDREFLGNPRFSDPWKEKK